MKHTGYLLYFPMPDLENVLYDATVRLANKTLRAPFDAVQQRLQLQSLLLKQGVIDKKYDGVFNCVQRMFKEEGTVPMYRFLIYEAWRSSIIGTLDFTTKNYFKKLSKKLLPEGIIRNVLSGTVSGAATLLVQYPTDILGFYLRNDVIRDDGTYRYDGVNDVVSAIWQSGGILGFYKGYILSVLGIAIYRLMYFCIYDRMETVKTYMNSSVFHLSITVLVGLFSYPIDTIRKNQTANHSNQSIIECTKQFINKDGVIALWGSAFGVFILRSLFSMFVLPTVIGKLKKTLKPEEGKNKRLLLTASAAAASLGVLYLGQTRGKRKALF